MENLPKMSRDVFEIVSTHSWTDFLLQLYKCLVLPRCMDSENGDDEVQSNLYSHPELNLLAWLNSFYDQERGNMFDDLDLPVRWIVNFDFDLMDGLVIGCILSHYAPFLAEKYLRKMYSEPITPEQCLHNSLLIIASMRELDIDLDIESTEITDPNPITMVILVHHLHQVLPHYNP